MEHIKVPEDIEITEEELAIRFPESFFTKCNFVLLSIYAQAYFTGQSNPPQKGIVDHLNALHNSERATTEKCLEDLKTAMKKFNLWVSPSDLQYLVTFVDPFLTGTPSLNLIASALDKQKVLNENMQNLQFTVGSFFVVMLESLEMCLATTKKLVAQKLEDYAN